MFMISSHLSFSLCLSVSVSVSVCLSVSLTVRLCPLREIRSPYLGKVQQLQEQRYPFLPVCAVFSCVHTMVWLAVFVICNVHTDVDASDCTRGAVRTPYECQHRTSVSTVRVSAPYECQHRKWTLEENIPCLTGDSNLRQYCAWLFSRTL